MVDDLGNLNAEDETEEVEDMSNKTLNRLIQALRERGWTEAQILKLIEEITA